MYKLTVPGQSLNVTCGAISALLHLSVGLGLEVFNITRNGVLVYAQEV